MWAMLTLRCSDFPCVSCQRHRLTTTVAWPLTDSALVPSAVNATHLLLPAPSTFPLRFALH